MVSVKIKRVKPDFGFDATDALNNTVRFDSSDDFGGQNYGVRPMQSLLMALGTCSGIDVISILNKMRQPVIDYSMDITGEREKDKEPAVWIKAHIEFHISGPDDLKKVNQAIELSINKYCSVAETMRRAGCEITWNAVLNQ